MSLRNRELIDIWVVLIVALLYVFYLFICSVGLNGILSITRMYITVQENHGT